jgi:hypothetical protein
MLAHWNNRLSNLQQMPNKRMQVHYTIILLLLCACATEVGKNTIALNCDCEGSWKVSFTRVGGRGLIISDGTIADRKSHVAYNHFLAVSCVSGRVAYVTSIASRPTSFFCIWPQACVVRHIRNGTGHRSLFALYLILSPRNCPTCGLEGNGRTDRGML